MKCPKCGFDKKVKYGMVCDCNYVFSLNPKVPESAGMTDGRFVWAIRVASQNGTVCFTQNQLYAAYCSNAKAPIFIWVVVLFMILFFSGVSIFQESMFGVIGFVMAAVISVACAFSKPRVLSREAFDACVAKWHKDRKRISRMITRPSLHKAPRAWPEDDIYDYGVERILIVQHDLLVDLLVKNNQHAEQRMLVIAESGYPEYLSQRVNSLLAERDDLPVYLLHDADAAGQAMAGRVGRLDWLEVGDRTVVDLGAFPKDFAQLNSTANFDRSNKRRELPVDALSMASLGVGMAACFASQSTFAQELMRERDNVAGASSSFG